MSTCPDCRKRHSDGLTTCPDDGATLVPDALFTELAKNEIVAGSIVGEYRVEAKIGEGGFGAVYRAVHPLIGKAVAIKLLSRAYSEDPQIVSRFIAEARAVNQIRHKNIVDIFSFGSLPDGRQFYVMELLVGRPLDTLLEEKGFLQPREVLPILRGVLRALTAAHGAGLVHRDLKPENVFLCTDEDGVVTPKLIDFGIAKLLGDESVEHKTRTGTPMGTPYYMSPEQCRGKNVDHRTDLYAIGAMLHVMLTGQRPFTGDSAMDLLFKQMTEAPPRLSDHRPGLSPALEGLVLALLAKDAAKRPQTAKETLERLEAALNDTPERLSMPDGIAPGTASEPRSDAAEARTGGLASQTSSTTLGGGASATVASATPPSKGVPWLPIGVALGVVLSVGIAFVALREPGGAATASSRGPSPTSDATATPSPSDRVAGSSGPVVTPSTPTTPSPSAADSAVSAASSSATTRPVTPSSALTSTARSAAPNAPTSAPKTAPTFNPNDVSFDD
jgi:eukaryotic-like serine/threonine-protein kinase